MLGSESSVRAFVVALPSAYVATLCWFGQPQPAVTTSDQSFLANDYPDHWPVVDCRDNTVVQHLLHSSRRKALPTPHFVRHRSRPVGLPFAGRSPVFAQGRMAATSQPLSTQAALDVLKLGGSAVDAAIAANAMVSLCESSGTGSPSHVNDVRMVPDARSVASLIVCLAW